MLLMMLVMAFPVAGILLFLYLPWKTALVLYAAGTAGSAFYHTLMMRSQRMRVTTGRRGMLGRSAVVITRSGDSLLVRCEGEIWKAEVQGGGSLAPGSEGVVVGIRGLALVLEPPVSQPGRTENRAPEESPATWTGRSRGITL
jgi:membrane protein implicated in regulation of membrane protease activity